MDIKNKKPSKLVYSTDLGEICSNCVNPIKECRCSASGMVILDGIVRVGRQTKGRKGKGVTVITGIDLGLKDLRNLAKELKQKSVSGGTIKGGVIEIQGDHRTTLIKVLKDKGYTVKSSGG